MGCLAEYGVVARGLRAAFAVCALLALACLAACASNGQAPTESSGQGGSSAQPAPESASSDGYAKKPNTLYYNEDHVAVLAQVPFEKHESDDGSITVTVPRDSYTEQVVDTDRPYVAFGINGERYPEGDSRLGIVEIIDQDSSCIIELSETSVSDDGAHIICSGTHPLPADLQKVFWSDGPVTFTAPDSKEQWDRGMEEIGKQLRESGDGKAMVLAVPPISEETVEQWISSIDHPLTMWLVRAGENARDAKPYEDEAEMDFDISKYKGYYTDYNPGAGLSSVPFRLFEGDEFLDSWMVDCVGVLWYVDTQGSHWMSTTRYESWEGWAV